jgi:hypothetical protein
MQFRHSVYFDTCEAANKAEMRIRRGIAPDDIYQSNDGETGLIEVRFFTARKLDRYEQTCAVRGASTYVLDCDVW